jgi:ankyrin repeat protein
MKEEEYHATMGLQNAFHLAVACPHADLIEFLISMKVDADSVDNKGINPFNLVSSSPN